MVPHATAPSTLTGGRRMPHYSVCINTVQVYSTGDHVQAEELFLISGTASKCDSRYCHASFIPMTGDWIICCIASIRGEQLVCPQINHYGVAT